MVILTRCMGTWKSVFFFLRSTSINKSRLSGTLKKKKIQLNTNTLGYRRRGVGMEKPLPVGRHRRTCGVKTWCDALKTVSCVRGTCCIWIRVRWVREVTLCYRFVWNDEVGGWAVCESVILLCVRNRLNCKLICHENTSRKTMMVVAAWAVDTNRFHSVL